MLEGLLGGLSLQEAAAAGGFSLAGFYGARRRDPDFAEAWKQALASSAAAERRLRAYEERGSRPGRGELRIAPANRRLFQRRVRRNVRFDEVRRKAFLDHFAWTCDTRAAAAAAGVHESTVSLHRRTDPAFAEAYREALGLGYDLLEAEALRQRLAAQRALREALEEGPAPACSGEGDHPQHGGGAAPSSGPPAPPPPAAAGQAQRGIDLAAEFERVLKLLSRWDRKPRRPDGRASPDGRRQVWTFDAAIALLDKRLKALGASVPPLPPEQAARYDGLEGDPSE